MKPPRNCSLARGVEGKGVGDSEAPNRCENEREAMQGEFRPWACCAQLEGKQERDRGAKREINGQMREGPIWRHHQSDMTQG